VEVVGDILVDNGVAGICIQLKKTVWSVTTFEHGHGPIRNPVGKEMQGSFNVLCPPAARQQRVADCDNMSVIFPLPIHGQRPCPMSLGLVLVPSSPH
jgi:hypothetical protein